MWSGPTTPSTPSQPELRNPAPTIVSVTLSIGSTGGGASITITGAGLLPGIRVAFGATNVAAYFGPYSDRISVTTPSHASGSVDVVVTNVDGQNGVAIGAYTFAAPESFDVNGTWRGVSFAGDYDEPFTFTVVNGAVVSMTCSTSGLVKLSPPAPIIHGEFSFRGEDGFFISGTILAPNEAKGRVGRLFDAESTEETHFDHLRGSWVECRELGERALERDDIDAGIRRGDIETVDWDGRFTRATLRRLTRARGVDEHPPHHLGGRQPPR